MTFTASQPPREWYAGHQAAPCPAYRLAPRLVSDANTEPGERGVMALRWLNVREMADRHHIRIEYCVP